MRDADLILVGGLTVIGVERGEKRATGPAKLDPLCRLPATEKRIEDPAYESIPATDAIEELEETAKLYLLLHGHRTRSLTPEQVADLERRFRS